MNLTWLWSCCLRQFPPSFKKWQQFRFKRFILTSAYVYLNTSDKFWRIRKRIFFYVRKMLTVVTYAGWRGVGRLFTLHFTCVLMYYLNFFHKQVLILQLKTSFKVQTHISIDKYRYVSICIYIYVHICIYHWFGFFVCIMKSSVVHVRPTGKGGLIIACSRFFGFLLLYLM